MVISPGSNPRPFIERAKAAILDPNLPRMMVEDKAVSDQLHADVMRMAEHVGVNGRSDGFVASVLIACNVLDWLADSLLTTEEEGREVGAKYIGDAALRLRLLALWGEQGNCKRISLMEMKSLL
jgi:hypothetical protein